MCGIAGLYNYKTEQPVDQRLIKTMVADITHRGPDDDGFYFDQSLGMGMRRLSIIDLAGGAQPISNESGHIWIVFNGEIYNFQDLRRELESFGHKFKTQSDTETIVHAYEQWGFEALARLNGMFGLALWDAQQRTLILARDPFGIKPLYYWDNGRTLLFGSEIKPLLRHPQVERRVDLHALDEYLALTYIPSPRTAFAGIGKLLPGHALVCTPGSAQQRRFYEVKPNMRRGQSEQELVAELRDTLFRAIERQMIADVPVGAMLSGGIDSTTVATIMTEIRGEPIDTFTVGFEAAFANNELAPARAMAHHLGSRHHEIVVPSHEYADFLPRSIWHLEEPVATASTLAFYKVCQLARQHVKVVLTGQGADEPFAGYHRYLGERYGSLYRKVPAMVREGLVAPLIKRLPRNERLKRAVASLGQPDTLKRMLQIYATIDPALKSRLQFNGNGSKNDSYETFRLWQSDVAHLDGLSQMLYIDARSYQADNLAIYGDKMSMALSLEARVPFLDLELMALVESIPSHLKIKGWTRKQILKKAVAKWIPAEVIARKKIGFETPVDGWFRQELHHTITDQLLDAGSACREFFQCGTIQEILDEHQRGRHDHKRILFSLLTFEIWYQQFIKPAHWHTSYPK